LKAKVTSVSTVGGFLLVCIWVLFGFFFKFLNRMFFFTTWNLEFKPLETVTI